MTTTIDKSDIRETNTDLKRDDRVDMAEKLGEVLASTYVLYQKTQSVHWNVTGPMFVSVHKMTEAQYEDLAESIDDLAERIRALGAKTPVGLSTYINASTIDDQVEWGDVDAMLTQLSSDNIAVANQMREFVKTAEKANDVFTADLLTSRIGALEEASWMLSASLS
ncbi:Dps family protein [Parasphingorhabdus cellanae]|uniref:DNA starvation/stationary phase protection protein n=1 Tax=Parasphingorhabdus cellanae TaxID=2806553 RepID=A0ABX7SZ61_9SPHN|nr:DNA starvation/stationary phase protection protein [Parasphingorhabdus cellanae]QTD54564.1 DNA starvation/stationary phase protection protein [Parasphingorhabdus cellanae]